MLGDNRKVALSLLVMRHLIVTCTLTVLRVCWRCGQTRTPYRRSVAQLEAAGSLPQGSAAAPEGSAAHPERDGRAPHALGQGLFLRLPFCHAQSGGEESARLQPCQSLPQDAPGLLGALFPGHLFGGATSVRSGGAGSGGAPPGPTSLGPGARGRPACPSGFDGLDGGRWHAVARGAAHG